MANNTQDSSNSPQNVQYWNNWALQQAIRYTYELIQQEIARRKTFYQELHMIQDFRILLGVLTFLIFILIVLISYGFIFKKEDNFILEPQKTKQQFKASKRETEIQDFKINEFDDDEDQEDTPLFSRYKKNQQAYYGEWDNPEKEDSYFSSFRWFISELFKTRVPYELKTIDTTQQIQWSPRQTVSSSYSSSDHSQIRGEFVRPEIDLSVINCTHFLNPNERHQLSKEVGQVNLFEQDRQNTSFGITPRNKQYMAIAQLSPNLKENSKGACPSPKSERNLLREDI